jgi:Secretion system C-terminal sorting domain
MKPVIICFFLLFFQTSFANKILDYSPIPPVELTSFAAQLENGYVLLSWATASEFNNSQFEIEQSISLNQWQTIGRVEGHGTTSEPHQYSFRDGLNGVASIIYYYRLKQIDFDGTFEYSNSVEIQLQPKTAKLLGNFPNPFNPSTKIKYQVAVTGIVSIKVYNILGKEVAELVNENKNPGIYEVEFNAADFPSGFYFYTISTNNFTETKKMILLK